MLRKIASSLAAVGLAFLILATSLLRSAKINYAFTGSLNQTPPSEQIDVNYWLPYPGRILPDSPFWSAKALRDKIWLTITVNKSKKAELLLLFADKRLASSKILFEKKKAEIAFSTLTKAEKYLQEAVLLTGECWKNGVDEKILANKIALSALKHRQVAEEILVLAPEDARPGIIKFTNYSKEVYVIARDLLISHQQPAPENPFDME